MRKPAFAQESSASTSDIEGAHQRLMPKREICREYFGGWLTNKFEAKSVDTINQGFQRPLEKGIRVNNSSSAVLLSRVTTSGS